MTVEPILVYVLVHFMPSKLLRRHGETSSYPHHHQHML